MVSAISFIFSAKAYRCLCIFCQQRLLYSGVNEKIFLSGILLHVAVPFLLILRLLCLSPPYPGTAERMDHHSYGVCFLSVEVRIKTIIWSINIMPGMSFQAGLWCASCKSDSCSYQRDQKQPDGRKSHEHLLIFNHLFSLRYIIYPSIYYHLFPSVFITLKICCRNRITVSHKVHCNGSGLNKMTKVGMSESVPRTGDWRYRQRQSRYGTRYT